MNFSKKPVLTNETPKIKNKKKLEETLGDNLLWWCG